MFQLFLLFSLFANSMAILRGSPLSFNDINNVSHWGEFIEFQLQFNKHYTTTELETRFSIFNKNVINIMTHNLDLTQTFKMGINQFTDLTPDEFKSQYVSRLNASVESYNCNSFSSSASGTPESIDWRYKKISINRRNRRRAKRINIKSQ